jgi:hypothetical protein
MGGQVIEVLGLAPVLSSLTLAAAVVLSAAVLIGWNDK